MQKIGLFGLPISELREMVAIERDRLGWDNDQLEQTALGFFGGKIPEPRKPADYINLAYHLRKLL